jgi:hypothetical protein
MDVIDPRWMFSEAGWKKVQWPQGLDLEGPEAELLARLEFFFSVSRSAAEKKIGWTQSHPLAQKKLSPERPSAGRGPTYLVFLGGF